MEISHLLAGGATKSIILNSLSEQWPLSLKKIFHAVKKVSIKSMTYQAVYKSVKELLDDGVLSRQENEYLISPIWVEKSSEFINRLAEAYEKNNLAKSRRIQELNFSSLSEAWDFVLSRLNTDFFGESKEAYLQFRRFFFFPLSKEDISKLKEFASKKKVYVMCRQNSVIDRMAAGFLSSIGAKAITGIECARPTNVLVNGNCVINFYILSDSERPGLSAYYNGTKDMKNINLLNLESFGNIFFKKIKVRLIINRDPGVLSDVLEQTKLILSKRKD
jgi:hypothetical protein